LVWRAVGGIRTRQAASGGDIIRPRRRVLEVKTTTRPGGGWPLGPALIDNDYALVRLDQHTWRPVEAWLVAKSVAQRHASASGRLTADGHWRARATALNLRRY
jgi:hypothetical protein